MPFHAEILARHEEGVLERILRVCRHRNFAVSSFQARIDAEEQVVRIELAGESDRPFQLLVRQLEKLFEVIDVETLAPRREPQAKTKPIESRPHVGPVRRAVYASSKHG